MAETPSQEQAPVIPVRPQPDVYTALLIISVVVLCVAIGVVIWRLTSSAEYGLSMEHIFKPGTPLPKP